MAEKNSDLEHKMRSILIQIEASTIKVHATKKPLTLSERIELMKRIGTHFPKKGQIPPEIAAAIKEFQKAEQEFMPKGTNQTPRPRAHDKKSTSKTPVPPKKGFLRRMFGKRPHRP